MKHWQVLGIRFSSPLAGLQLMQTGLFLALCRLLDLESFGKYIRNFGSHDKPP